MKILNIFLFLVLSVLSFAQIDIEYLNDVPEEFKEKYFSEPRNYNPLQVGNMWQYYNSEFDKYFITSVVQDSIINGKLYFKKKYYYDIEWGENLVAWERNDTTSGVSFMLDFEDVNYNGDYLEELPLDSLENPLQIPYSSYKYSFRSSNRFFFFPGEKTMLSLDSNWVVLKGDTLLSKFITINELFRYETIIEDFGIYDFDTESPVIYCMGAIINGRQYGTIVSVDENVNSIPTVFLLENNYPNPFNPATTINYQLPQNGLVQLKIYDLLGQEVATLVNEFKNAGYYSVRFDASSYPSGVYIYSMRVNDYINNRKMTILK